MQNSERTIKTIIDNESYVIVSDDQYLETVKGSFEPHMVKLFKSLILKNDVIFDVGANIGCTSVLFGKLSKKVFAFEPSPSTIKFLEKNISAAKLNNVNISNIGLGEKEGEYQLTFAPTNRSGGFVSDKIQASDGHVNETIIIRTLDDIAIERKIDAIDFIKIDVEGFELSVISGGRHVLDKFKPVVVLEMNHWCLNAFQRIAIPDFFDSLRDTFPLLFAVDGESFLDLNDPSDAYIVMYHHILNFRFPNIVAAYDDNRLNNFLKQYTHRIPQDLST